MYSLIRSNMKSIKKELSQVSQPQPEVATHTLTQQRNDRETVGFTRGFKHDMRMHVCWRVLLGTFVNSLNRVQASVGVISHVSLKHAQCVAI